MNKDEWIEVQGRKVPDEEAALTEKWVLFLLLFFLFGGVGACDSATGFVEIFLRKWILVLEWELQVVDLVSDDENQSETGVEIDPIPSIFLYFPEIPMWHHQLLRSLLASIPVGLFFSVLNKSNFFAYFKLKKI